MWFLVELSNYKFTDQHRTGKDFISQHETPITNYKERKMDNNI